MTIPDLNPLHEYFPELVRMVAQTSWLPHPDTVRALGGAAFPTLRARKSHTRCGPITQNGHAIGMYDDNTTPRWALLWAHGIPMTHHPSGRTFAHVWESGDDITAYTHLANLVMVPEPFASLTDKNGPLTGYLRWHAWTVYGWKPDHMEQPQMPPDYDNIPWRYLPKFAEPGVFIRQRLADLNNERARNLRQIMEQLGWL